MAREFIKGNDAVAKAALLAGCRHYYGYPITPSSEIVHSCAVYFPQAGATFVQAESEVAAINMVYGASSAGQRVLTASSGPGISLKQEGVSYLAGAELPAVIVDIMRAGPGLGNIWPEQGDYHQVVKGGGHGNYKCIVLAPDSPQEMCDHTILAFELADKYRGPVYVLSDAYIGQMMAPVEFPTKVLHSPKKDWAIDGTKATVNNFITSIKMDPVEMENHNIMLQDKYADIEAHEVRFSEMNIEDAEVVMVAYGITARVAHSCVDDLRKQGIKVGLFRPITLFPFPSKRLRELSKKTKLFVTVELSNGQMHADVRASIPDSVPVEFYGRMGGAVMGQMELNAKIKELCKKHLH